MEKKRSLKYLLVSVCLALLVASIGAVLVGATEKVTPNGNLTIQGATLDLNETLGIAFAVPTSAWTDETKVYLHSSNPGEYLGEASIIQTLTATDLLKDKETELPVEIAGGKNGDVPCYIVVSDGFPADELHTTVYARVCNDTEYGPVYKTGVLELVYLMKDKVEADSTLDEDGVRLGLYNSIIAYSDAALKVVDDGANYAKYHFVKVEDGYINDGLKSTYGVFAENTDIMVSDSVNEASVGKQIYGWKNGNRFYADSVGTAVLTVKGAATYTPVYGDGARYDDNPYINTESTSSKPNANIGARWNDIYYFTTKANDGKVTFTWPSDNNSSTRVFENQPDGTSHLKISHSKVTNETTPNSKTAYTEYFHMDNPMSIDGNTVVSFDAMFPTLDKDGDGVYNESIGDYFVVGGNEILFKVPVNLSTNDFSNPKEHMTQAPTAANADNIAVLCLAARQTNGIVTSWGIELRTINSNDTGNTDKALSGIKGYFSLDEYHNVSIEIVPNEDGTISGLNVYVDGALYIERNADRTELNTGLSYNADNGTLKLNDPSRKTVTLGFTDQSRACADLWLSDLAVYEDITISAANVMAMDGYSDTVAADEKYVVYGTADNTARRSVNWSSIASLPNVTSFGNYLGYTGPSSVGGASWVYSARNDAIVFNNLATTDADGNIGIYVKNPYGSVADADVANTALVLEFDMTLYSSDFDGDGNWNERNGDYCFDTSSTTVMQGYFTFGYHSSFDTTDLQLSNHKITSLQLRRNNTNEGWYLEYHPSETNWSSSARVNHSNWATAKLVLTPNENGIITKVEFFLNDTLYRTAMISGGNATDKNNYVGTGASLPTASIRTNGIFGFTYYTDNRATGNIGFRNVRAYTQTISQ